MSKTSPVFEALGMLDELNSLLGVCFVKAHKRDDEKVPQEGSGAMLRIAPLIRAVQECLFIAQAQVAGADKKISAEHVAHMEAQIAELESNIENPHGFVIAGATELSAHLDLARAVSRRVERAVLTAGEQETGPVLSPELKQYLNRLSSLLYVLARYGAQDAHSPEASPAY